MLIAALGLFCVIHLYRLRGRRSARWALAGWLTAAAALISPLCALSVALFSARAAQHMLLVLVAAPLLALALPARGERPLLLWGALVAFTAALWFWHMPGPYAATFASTAVYWLMHLSLFGSAVFLWRELLCRGAGNPALRVCLGGIASMQMGLLGAVLSLASHPLYAWHLTHTQAWGLTALEDQQLGGALMWVPGIGLFLWAALRSLQVAWQHAEDAGLA